MAGGRDKGPTPAIRADAAIVADALALGRRDEVIEQVAALLPAAIAEYRWLYPNAIYDPDSIRCMFCAVTRDPDAIQAHVEECGLRFLAGLRKAAAPIRHCPWCGQSLVGHRCLVMPE